MPEFWDNLGPGNDDEHIKFFRATYLQGLMWKKQGGGPVPTNHMLSNPGEPCWDAETDQQAPTCNPPANWGIIQLTAFIIPDSALPEALRGSSIGGAEGVNPYEFELFR